MSEQRENGFLEARLNMLQHRLQVAVVGWVLSVLLLGLLSIAAVRANARPEVLVARGLDLVDARGRLHGTLGVADDGTTRLILGDERGKPRVTLGIGVEGEVRFVLYDAQARTRVALGVLSDGTPWMRLLDAQTVTRVGVSVGQSTVMSLFDDKGVERMGLRIHGDGLPALTLFDRQAVPLIGLGEAPDRTSGLTFYDTKKRRRIGLGIAQHEDPWLTISDARGGDLFSAP